MASRRNYVTSDEVEELSNVTSEVSDLQISEAEELIDGYVGFQNKFFPHDLQGKAASGAVGSITLQSNQQNIYDVDYFKWCEVEIIGGTGAGQRRVITASTKEGVLTPASNFATAPDNTSFYKIYQLGKFPRHCDVLLYSESSPTTYYKQIPENIKRAVAAQVEYMIQMGLNFFATDQSEKVSERIGDYSYANAESEAGGVGPSKLIAPKAKILLRGFKNRTGQILV